MKWSIPYSKGALEDQSVMLLRCFDLINRVKGEYERQQQKEREKKMESNRNKSPRGGSRPTGRRRR